MVQRYDDDLYISTHFTSLQSYPIKKEKQKQKTPNNQTTKQKKEDFLKNPKKSR